MTDLFEEDSNNLFFRTLFDKINDSTNTNDINENLYLTILYIIFEVGFVPNHNDFQENTTDDFNIQAIETIVQLPLNEIYKIEGDEFRTYKAVVRLGADGTAQVIGLPSVNKQSPFLTVNIYMERPKFIKAFAFNTSLFISKNADGLLQFHKERQLSLCVKNELAVPVKQLIHRYHSKACSPQLLALPLHIVDIITKMLNRTDQKSLETVFRQS